MRAGAEVADLPLPQMLAELDATPGGLTGEQARARLERFGPNEIAEKRTSTVLVLPGYFWGPTPWMIEVSLVLQHWPDAAVIGVLLAMNVAVAFTEEHQAANAIAALKQRLAATARALRGAWASLPVRELVPGDVIRVRLGDVAPADARLLGDASVQVYPTGAASFFGRTTALVETAGTVSHFQQVVLKIGRYLIVLVLVTLAVSLARGNPVLQTVEFALVVTIASVPVALPAVLSVTMAVGARQLARRQAVVSAPARGGGTGRHGRAVLGQDRHPGK